MKLRVSSRRQCIRSRERWGVREVVELLEGVLRDAEAWGDEAVAAAEGGAAKGGKECVMCMEAVRQVGRIRRDVASASGVT